MRVLAIWMLATWFGCSANDDIPAPRIAAIDPDHATPVTNVRVTGEYFCQQMETEDPLACEHVGSVQFGSIVANVTTYADSEIVVEVPAGPSGRVHVTVSAGGHVSNPRDFTIE